MPSDSAPPPAEPVGSDDVIADLAHVLRYLPDVTLRAEPEVIARDLLGRMASVDRALAPPATGDGRLNEPTLAMVEAAWEASGHTAFLGMADRRVPLPTVRTMLRAALAVAPEARDYSELSMAVDNPLAVTDRYRPAPAGPTPDSAPPPA